MRSSQIERGAIARRQQIVLALPPPFHTGPTAWMTCFAGSR